MNNRIPPKEQNLIKGALRRVFSRSELHKEAIAKTIVPHVDTTRPRVKTWCKCPLCDQFIAKSYMKVDHIQPVVPLHTALLEMDANTLVDRIWCEAYNLQAICDECHDKKTAIERKQRTQLRKEKKNEQSTKGPEKATKKRNQRNGSRSAKPRTLQRRVFKATSRK